MKTKIILSLFCISLCVHNIQSQEPLVAGVNEAIFANATVIDLSQLYDGLDKQKQFYTDDQWKALMQKKYLFTGYSPCFVDNYKTVGYLRYNLADDQMEFLKDEKTYYLKKELGRKVRFTSTKTTYKVYELDGRLDYFLVAAEGKNSLLVKQIVKYIKPKESQNGYDGYRPANFLRVKDKYYLANGNKLTKLPRKKKGFFNAFGKDSKKVQSYAKKNKLSYKSLDDITKIVEYYNTL